VERGRDGKYGDDAEAGSESRIPGESALMARNTRTALGDKAGRDAEDNQRHDQPDLLRREKQPDERRKRRDTGHGGGHVRRGRRCGCVDLPDRFVRAQTRSLDFSGMRPVGFHVINRMTTANAKTLLYALETGSATEPTVCKAANRKPPMIAP